MLKYPKRESFFCSAWVNAYSLKATVFYDPLKFCIFALVGLKSWWRPTFYRNHHQCLFVGKIWVGQILSSCRSKIAQRWLHWNFSSWINLALCVDCGSCHWDRALLNIKRFLLFLILSRFYPDFLKTHFIQILSWFYPNFWKYLDKIRIKSG